MDPSLLNQVNIQSILGTLGVLGFIGAIFVFIVVVAVLGMRHARKMNERWAEWARTRGLALTGSYPTVHATGTMHGLGVQMVTHVYKHRRHGRRGGSTSTSYKHETIATPLMNIGDLTLSREGFFASIGKTFGGQDIVVGNPAFDAAFVVRSTNEHAARQVLTPAVCAALLEAQRVLGDVHVESGGVRTLRNGMATPESVDQSLDVLARTALTFGR